MFSMMNLDQMAADVISQKHEHTSNQIVQGINKIEAFKKEIAFELMEICEKSDLVKLKIKKFALDKEN